MPVLMPSPVFRWFVAGTGAPAAGYKAKFFAAGTAINPSNGRQIFYADGSPYASPPYIAILNAEGYADIRLGVGKYLLQVTDSLDNQVFVQDGIEGQGSFGTGFVNTVIASDTSGLKDADPVANHFVWCAGYYAIGDGGHGFFWNQTSSAADDTGYVIASVVDATKRWFRVPDESGDVRAASFGYISTKSGNLSNQLIAAAAYCTSYNKRLLIGPGSTAIIGTDTSDFYLYAPSVYFEAGSVLTGTGLFTNLMISAYADGTPEPHFTGFQAKLIIPQVNAHPEWWGASLSSIDNTAAFNKWFASLPNGGTFVLPPGTWDYVNTTLFSYPTVPFVLYGKIHAMTTGSDIPTGMYFPSDSQFRMHQLLFDNGAKMVSNGGSAIAVTGDTGIAGQITSSAGFNINSGNNITAIGNIVAGYTSTGGNIFGKAGTSSQEFSAGGQLTTSFGDISTSGTTVTNLRFFVVPLNTLIAVGDRLTVKGAGFITSVSGSGDRTIAVTFGGVTLISAIVTIGGTWTGANATCNWHVEIDIWVDATNHIRSSARMVNDLYNLPGTSTFPAWAKYVSNALTLTADQTLQFKGTALVSGSITQSLLVTEYYPAP